MLSLGFGQGEDVVMNSNYQTVARVPGGNGLQADLHDFQIAPHGRLLHDGLQPIRCDLSSVDGVSDGVILDTAVQEIDMKTGLVRWEWHSLDHVAPRSPRPPRRPSATPWDWFHINSIDAEGGRRRSGNIFISARSTWAGYQLEGGSGNILWRLGGLKSSFKLGPGTETAWQHDGRILSGGEVTFFDDGSNPPIHQQSRGLRIALDFSTHEAHLIAAYTHPDPPLLTPSQGNMQTLADGNAVVGYGGVPAISEFAPERHTAVRRAPAVRHVLLSCVPLPLERAPRHSADCAGQPEQHRRRDDRAHELERRKRSGLLARACGATPRVSHAQTTIPASSLRKLDDPAQEVRLRSSAGAGRGWPCARRIEAGRRQLLRRCAAFRWRPRMARYAGRPTVDSPITGAGDLTSLPAT